MCAAILYLSVLLQIYAEMCKVIKPNPSATYNQRKRQWEKFRTKCRAQQKWKSRCAQRWTTELFCYSLFSLVVVMGRVGLSQQFLFTIHEGIRCDKLVSWDGVMICIIQKKKRKIFNLPQINVNAASFKDYNFHIHFFLFQI